MQVVWTDRRFNFDFPPGLYETILMRLRHAPMRYRAITEGMDDPLLTRQLDGKWSIKENVGHIPVLDETLWNDRLTQFIDGADELIGADMTNQLTSDTNFNEQALPEILDRLESSRAAFIARLDALAPQDFARTAQHPRLKVPMRLVDMLYFIAEHDDYHLAHIRNLSKEV